MNVFFFLGLLGCYQEINNNVFSDYLTSIDCSNAQKNNTGVKCNTTELNVFSFAMTTELCVKICLTDNTYNYAGLYEYKKSFYSNLKLK